MNYSLQNIAENKHLVAKRASRILDIIIIWTLVTTLIVWLPLVRIIGKPNEYYWGLLGYHGEGIDGPYWMFLIGAIYAIVMFKSVYRSKSRWLSHILLMIWQLVFNGIISIELLDLGLNATIQGQGWGWEFPIWILGIPSLVALVLTAYWIYLEHSHKLIFCFKPWSKINTVLLGVATTLFFLAVLLFHLGDNYNWVTALAILTTICQWIVSIESIKPVNKKV